MLLLNTITTFVALFKRAFLALGALLFLVAAANIEYFTAQIPLERQNEIQLEWRMSSDTAILTYHVFRKMSHDSEFVKIAEVQRLPAHISPRIYTFVDRNVFKTTASSEPIHYELQGVTANGSIVLGRTQINYTTSGVRRTWGSIKSMFQ